MCYVSAVEESLGRSTENLVNGGGSEEGVVFLLSLWCAGGLFSEDESLCTVSVSVSVNYPVGSSIRRNTSRDVA